MRAWARLALACALATPALAEVRLEGSATSPSVGIVATSRGVWSPVVDAPGPRVLNPHGDLLGDGAPAVAEGSGRVVVAWRRPASDAVLVAVGATEWQAAVPVEAPGAVGTPVVGANELGVVVAWSDANGQASVAFIASDGSKVTQGIGEGHPLAIVSVGATVHVLSVVPQLPPIEMLRPMDIVLRPRLAPTTTLDIVSVTEWPIHVSRQVRFEHRSLCGSNATEVLRIVPAATGPTWWTELDEHGSPDLRRLDLPGRSGSTPAAWSRLSALVCER